MCFRLLAAFDPPLPAEALARLALAAGLDARTTPDGRFSEIAWGDCACSLYSLRAGRERLVELVASLRVEGYSLQLLLVTEEQGLTASSPEPASLDWHRFSEEGLAALEEGVVTALV